MIRLRVGNTPAASFEAVLDLLPDDAFAAPTRSTIPLLDYWRHPEPRVADLARELALPAATDSELTFEVAVAPRQGRGKSSFTDLMITIGGFVIAIEAKYREPPYQMVKDWLGSAPSVNRQAVLAGWLGMISETTGQRISSEQVGELPYQLVHRAASACHGAFTNRWVVYQVFDAAKVDQYRDTLARLRALTPALCPLGLAVVVSRATPTAALRDLEDSGRTTSDMAAAVRTELKRQAFYSFGADEVHMVMAQAHPPA